MSCFLFYSPLIALLLYTKKEAEAFAFFQGILLTVSVKAWFRVRVKPPSRLFSPPPPTLPY